MAPAERLISWLHGERQRLAGEIETFTSGKVRVSKTRTGRMLDVTGETLKDLHRRKREIDALLGGRGSDETSLEAEGGPSGQLGGAAGSRQPTRN